MQIKRLIQENQSDLVKFELSERKVLLYLQLKLRTIDICHRWATSLIKGLHTTLPRIAAKLRRNVITEHESRSSSLSDDETTLGELLAERYLNDLKVWKEDKKLEFKEWLTNYFELNKRALKFKIQVPD